MRLRRKKHLDERLDSCGDILLAIVGDDLHKYVDVTTIEKLNYKEIFGNDNTVVLELGCGRGTFAVELAKQNSDINVIAVEKISNVIVDACEHAISCNLPNLRFINCSAEQLHYYIPTNSISHIYLNFSCPFPKNSYANRRMTNIRLLEQYKQLLVADGLITQKTDNLPFFEYSLSQYKLANYQTLHCSYDLYNSPYIIGNIATEYETKFVSLGEKINYISVKVPPVNK